MTDIALHWDNAEMTADLRIEDGSLARDAGLRTAILISLFSDARAPDGADLPEPGADRRGWWGDAFAADGAAPGEHGLGSTLWLLARAKLTPATLAQARRACLDALAWLVADGVAGRVDVAVEAQASDGIRQRLAVAVMLDRPQGPGRQRFDFTWEASAT